MRTKAHRHKGTQARSEVGTWERGDVGTVRRSPFVTFPPSHVPTRARRWALTLVELMVVVVILGLLATTVTISVRDYLVTGKQAAAKQEIAQLQAALELFYMENDRYPTNAEGLAVLLQRNDKHPDGLLHGGDLNDPWGHPYQYVYPGVQGTFDLACYGADGREGGTGADSDLNSWELK